MIFFNSKSLILMAFLSSILSSANAVHYSCKKLFIEDYIKRMPPPLPETPESIVYFHELNKQADALVNRLTAEAGRTEESDLAGKTAQRIKTAPTNHPYIPSRGAWEYRIHLPLIK